jgi:hypothetical protein
MATDLNTKTITVKDTAIARAEQTVHAKATHNKASFAQRHAQTPSKTLMRKAVKKPGASLKRQLHVQTRLESAEQTADLAKLAPSASILGKSTHKKATSVKKSQFISHFAWTHHNKNPKAVAAPPPHNDLPHISWSDNPLSKSDAIVQMEEAFKKATAHEPLLSDAKSIKGTHKRAAAWTVSASLVLVIGVGISLNFTNLRLVYASSQAGFYASLPKKLPKGYSLSNLTYGSNDVKTSFKNNSNDTTYAIVQRATSWGSDGAMLNGYEGMGQSSYQTASIKGINVYMYGSDTAAWISHGVWYTLYGNNSIGSGQILSIAASTV